MARLALIGGQEVAAVSTPETRLAYESLSQSRVWYAMRDLPEAKLRDMVPEVVDHLPGAVAEIRARLTPAPTGQVTAKLSELLTLTVPAGFSEGDRVEWLAAATNATKGIPADLLDMAFKAARAKADHPSKIIPAMMASFQGPWSSRRAAMGRIRQLVDIASGGPAPAAGDRNRIDPADVAEANRLNRRFGLTTRYHPDGAAFQLEPGQPDPTAPTT